MIEANLAGVGGRLRGYPRSLAHLAAESGATKKGPAPGAGGAKVDGVRHLASPVSPSIIKSQEPKIFCLTPDSIRAIFLVVELRGRPARRAAHSAATAIWS